MTRFLQLFIIATALAACGSEEQTGPYSDVLFREPYAPLSDSIKKDKNNDSLYFRRAVLLNKNELPEPALADFLKAWSLAKKEAYAFGAGTILLDKKPDSAIAFLQQAVKELPSGILLQMTLARAYDTQNKTDEALRETMAVLQKDSSQASAWILISDLFQKKGNTAEATAALERAFQMVPQNKDIAFKLAYLYAESKNPAAIALCDNLEKADVQGLFAEPLYIKGIYYANINDKAKALSFFEETIKRDYHFLNAYIEKGKILLQRKNTSGALTSFQLATTISPSFADGWYWTGQAHEALGKKEEAILDYQRAVGLDKDFSEAAEALKNLDKK